MKRELIKGGRPLPPIRATALPWNRREALSVLPPRNEARYAARAERAAKANEDILGNLCDAELLVVGDVVDLIKSHDWTYAYSDDGEVYRRGMRHERSMLDALKALRPEVARAVWAMYAPNGRAYPR